MRKQCAVRLHFSGQLTDKVDIEELELGGQAAQRMGGTNEVSWLFN